MIPPCPGPRLTGPAPEDVSNQRKWSVASSGLSDHRRAICGSEHGWVGGDGWLATADVHLRPAGESSIGDPQRFGHAAGRFQPQAARGTDPRRRSSPTIAAGQCCRRVLQGGKTVPVRRPAANLLRHGCAKVAERIRASMGVTAGEAGPRQRAPRPCRGWGCCYGPCLRRSVREPDYAHRRPGSRPPRRGAQ